MRSPRLQSASRRPSLARQRLVGLCFALVLAALLVLAVARPNPFARTETVRAVFDETGSLGKTLRDVRMGGVNVGEVAAETRRGDDVELELRLDEPSARPIYRDARAEIRPHLVFEGTVYVELFPGNPGTGRLGSKTIARSNTRVYVPLGEAVKALDRPRRTAFQGTMGELAPGLGGTAPASVSHALDNAPRLLGDLAPAARAVRGPYRGALRGAVRGMAGTAAALAREEERIAPLVRDAEQTFAAVGTEATRPLDDTLLALPPTLVELERGGRALRAILAEVRPFAVAIEPALRELTPTLRQARPLLRDARPTLRRVRPLVRELGVALDRTADAAPELLALVEALEPSLELLDRSLAPKLRRESRLGIPVYLQLLNGFGGGTGSLRFYEAPGQSSYGGGHAARVQGNFASASNTLPACADLGQLSPPLERQLVDLGICR